MNVDKRRIQHLIRTMELKATVSVSTSCNVVSLSATLVIYNNNLDYHFFVFSNCKNRILKIDPTFR